MLEQYFLKPETVDQIRSSWLAEPIERYVTSLSSQGYPPSYIRPRVPILRQFAQFAWTAGPRLAHAARLSALADTALIHGRCRALALLDTPRPRALRASGQARSCV